MKQKISCPCGNVITADIDEEIDIGKNPGTLDSILNGTFLNFICPGCGKKHKPEFPVVMLWPDKNLRIEVLPELERGAYARRKKDTPHTETIIGYPELADRLQVYRDGLEPVVIEALKYYLLERAAETWPDLKISVWYHGIASDEGNGTQSIEFHLHGIKPDEVAVSRIPWNLYEKNLMDFKKKPRGELFKSLRLRTYLSVNNMIIPDGLK